MILTGYTLEIFKSKCDSEAKGVHCYAHLNEDISAVLPYLNTVLGGFVYTTDPPSLMLKNYGKLITIHSRKIAVNALMEKEEAVKIVDWLQSEINNTWNIRHEIEPSYQSEKRPAFIEVLKFLPKSNCQQCGEKTCMVFVTRLMEGSADQDGCPEMSLIDKEGLKQYLSQFNFN